MTREYREWLRHEIDQARRARLRAAARTEPGTPSKRRDYWRTYSQTNRSRIREQQRERRKKAA